MALPLPLSGVRAKFVVPRAALELSSFGSLVQPLAFSTEALGPVLAFRRRPKALAWSRQIPLTLSFRHLWERRFLSGAPSSDW